MKKFLSAYVEVTRDGQPCQVLVFSVLVHHEHETVDALRGVIAPGLRWTQRDSLIGSHHVPNGVFSFLPSAL